MLEHFTGYLDQNPGPEVLTQELHQHDSYRA